MPTSSSSLNWPLSSSWTWINALSRSSPGSWRFATIRLAVHVLGRHYPPDVALATFDAYLDTVFGPGRP
jgi:hypothetical protein